MRDPKTGSAGDAEMSGDEKMSSSNATPSAHVGKPTATESGEGSDLVEEVARIVEPDAWKWLDRGKYLEAHRPIADESLTKARAIDALYAARIQSLEVQLAAALRATPPSPDGWQEEGDEDLVAFIRDEVCCARPVGGCELNDAAECPAQRVRAALASARAEELALRSVPVGYVALSDGQIIPADVWHRQFAMFQALGVHPLNSEFYGGVERKLEQARRSLPTPPLSAHLDAERLVEGRGEASETP